MFFSENGNPGALRGRIGSDEPHPRNPRRPASDLDVLRDIGGRLDRFGL